MNMIQCKNGHYYDADKNAQCPYCNSSSEAGVTRPLDSGTGNYFEAPAFPKTVSINSGMPQDNTVFLKTTPVNSASQNNQAIPKTMPVNNPQTNVTVALQVNEKGIDPVRGWLVCIDGKKKGRDFRIHSEKNYIGRAKSNDICLDFDESISRECHAIIAYDVKKNKFWIQSGESKSNTYVNDNILLVPVELNAYDTILIGETLLSFIPFCTEKFIWK